MQASVSIKSEASAIIKCLPSTQWRSQDLGDARAWQLVTPILPANYPPSSHNTHTHNHLQKTHT